MKRSDKQLVLRQGGLVAFPMRRSGLETVWMQAVDRIYHAKGRPSDNPMILHISERKDLAHWSESHPG